MPAAGSRAGHAATDRYNEDVMSKSKEASSRTPVRSIDTSDNALNILLSRLKEAVDLDEIRRLSDQLRQVIFHKQFMNG